MKRLVMAAVFSMVAGAAAQAMPLVPVAPVDTGITTVSGGCGPGGHRNGYGRCVPNFYGRPFFRGCPPGFHPNPYGRCRPNF